MNRGAGPRRSSSLGGTSRPLSRSQGLAGPTAPAAGSARQNGLRRAGPKAARAGKAPARWTKAKAARPEWGALEQGDRLEQHHVVYAQHVEAAGGDVWDPRNSLTITVRTHGRHHDGSQWRLPLTALFDEHYAFARELLGPAAYDYLHRRYAGIDPRLDALLAEV